MSTVESETLLADAAERTSTPSVGSPAKAWALWLARRIGLAVITLLVVSVIVFFATNALGDPVRAILGKDYDVSPDRVAALRQQLHLDLHPLQRYFMWLGDFLRGDLGTSVANSLPVWQLIGDRLVNTAFLVLVTAVIMIPLSIGLAMLSARGRGGVLDNVLQFFTLALAGVPEFVTGILLVALFSTSVFHWLPAVTVLPVGGQVWDRPASLILPIATLVLAVTPYLTRILRSTVIETLDSDYVELARLKGVPENLVLRRHALPNTVVPTIQVTALQLAWLVGGVVLIEYLFNYPGIGASLVDSVRNSDFPMVQALAMIIAAVYVVVNLIADVLSILFTPGPDGDGRVNLRGLVRDPKIVTGTVIAGVVILLAVLGPFVAPYGQNDIVGKPFTMEGGPLGTDYLGQDVLSRVLYGGRSVLIIAVLATLLGVALGLIVGVTAAYVGGWFDELLMRANDVLLAFPQILIALVVLSAVEQPTWWMIVLLVGIAHAPRVARVARGVALTYVNSDFVTAAEAMGEPRWRIALFELGPNLVVPLLAEAGLRLTYSIGMVAAIGFLGFASDPNAADWGQMTNENRLSLLVQPWGVLAPVLLIGLFTIGTNLIADGIGQRAAKGA